MLKDLLFSRNLLELCCVRIHFIELGGFLEAMKGKSFSPSWESDTNNKEEVILLCCYKFNIWQFHLHWRSNKLDMNAPWSTFTSKIRLSKIEFLFLREMDDFFMSFLPFFSLNFFKHTHFFAQTFQDIRQPQKFPVCLNENLLHVDLNGEKSPRVTTDVEITLTILIS